MPADSVFADSVPEASSFLSGKGVYGKRLGSTTDITSFAYNKSNTMLTPGSQGLLTEFYTLQTGLFPVFTTASTPVYINFTEVGAINEYLAGNFSAIFTGPPPASTTYMLSAISGLEEEFKIL